jgi:Leucine-rich repeat (LRR) protein
MRGLFFAILSICLVYLRPAFASGQVASPPLGAEIVASQSPSAFCASVTQIPRSECRALEALYNSTDGDNWSNHSGWLETNTPCSWSGVTCSGAHVRSLSLYQNQLSGPIPAELGNLANLTILSLSSNELSGLIPAELGNLANLTSLYLYSNELSGPIPAELGNLANLTDLWLSSNQLSGPIPAELGNLANLTYLSLGSNQLSGPANLH